MPGLVKVGYSEKDPEGRAIELRNTGTPHPYVVEYEVLIEDPYKVEQQTHRLLLSKREAKEWFRCSPEEAAAAIKQIAGNRIIHETYKYVERARVEALHEKVQVEKAVNTRLEAEELAIRQKYQEQIEKEFPPIPFWVYWIGGLILAAIAVSYFSPKGFDGVAWIEVAFGGWILGAILEGYLERKRKQSAKYLDLENQRAAELEAVRKVVGLCPKCGIQLKFDRAELLLASSRSVATCPNCKAALSPPPAGGTTKFSAKNQKSPP